MTLLPKRLAGSTIARSADSQRERLIQSLWVALRVLEEQAGAFCRIYEHSRREGLISAEMFNRKLRRYRAHAAVVRRVLESDALDHTGGTSVGTCCHSNH